MKDSYDEQISGLAGLFAILAQSQTRVSERLSELSASISRYEDSAQASRRRLEENLDALIRAITANEGDR